MEKEIYDSIIIGGGPAGLTAALYMSRNNLNVAFIEGKAPGGKMAEQSKIENYPGFEKIGGIELSMQMFNQARSNGAKFIYGNVKQIINISDFEKKIILEDQKIIFAKTLVIATGMKNVVPNDIENIEKFNGKGVSYCVLCDGTLFANKPCAIIGGGNSAIEEASYLSSIASKVYVFVRDGIHAEKKLVEDLKKHENVEIFLNSKIEKLIGSELLEKIIANIDGKPKEFEINGVFPYIGFRPSTDFIDLPNILNEKKFVLVNEEMETSIKNIFAIGDVIAKNIRQITTATSDGTIAAKTISMRIIK
ncbi:thioredoxin reductase [Metamycoplasma equirhinis]|uniref:NAD(P)/FAD-dependent oxidoreductase n=1 Tax=Metamycoplasma equirhinis TaxID=92402 RepID=UPI0025738A12|nr:FAD-dependent oxidoreductase [Metamycoplasma equirhinis]BDX52551.1 thioredoxin reductase [Metamycoplasma equirhinis]